MLEYRTVQPLLLMQRISNHATMAPTERPKSKIKCLLQIKQAKFSETHGSTLWVGSDNQLNIFFRIVRDLF